MSSIVVVGANWGDEGKGRIVDYLAGQAGASIRFQRGNNAGHTVVNDLGTFKLHQVPSGVFNPDCLVVLGPGMVISPEPLTKELAEVKAAGVTPKLAISDRATFCLPIHALEDTLEEVRLGDGAYGSTRQGIAPAYGDLDVGRRHGLPVLFSVGLDGLVLSAFPAFAGKFFKDADSLITRDLKDRGLLFHAGRIKHAYPFCWRCDTPLLYFAKTSWYIRTTAVRDGDQREPEGMVDTGEDELLVLDVLAQAPGVVGREDVVEDGELRGGEDGLHRCSPCRAGRVLVAASARRRRAAAAGLRSGQHDHARGLLGVAGGKHLLAGAQWRIALQQRHAVGGLVRMAAVKHRHRLAGLQRPPHAPHHDLHAAGDPDCELSRLPEPASHRPRLGPRERAARRA